jgi:AAA+ ATPase superfamily predicted ATPase
MNQSDFIGRNRELAILDREWKDSRSKMLILYGRRRVGKTRLVTHWIRKNAKNALYWVAEPTSSADQLRSFSQALYNSGNALPAPENFTYASWNQAFEQAARISRNDRFALVLDEFTYLMTLEEGIAGTLQNTWDHHLKESGIFLIISGSHLGMMERGVLSYQAPLYGRATSKLHLQPLPFSATRSMFPDYKADERVSLYAVLGGIPAYWEQFNPSLGLDKNIKQTLLSDGNLYQDEPRLLLQDFVSDIHNYAGILRAIAHGYRTPKEISSYSGLNARHISMYLSNLIQTGFVERRVSITAGPRSRTGRHHITDPFIRFYYRFLSQRQAQLALGVQDQALAEIKKQLAKFVGMHTWEELCQEWLIRATGKGILPISPNQTGSLWNRQAQIDVAGINPMEKTLYLGECKWGRRKIGAGVLKQLVEKTELVIPKNGTWKIFYLGFARQGWTEPATKFAQDQIEKAQGARWQVAGFLLRTLDEVDNELRDWTSG